MECPQKSFIILEGRAVMGGTWDLFRYPGVRSDSDMYTLGYRFRPWRNPKAIADGPAILSYIRETAREYGVDKSVRYNHHVRRATWSSANAHWTVRVETEAENTTEPQSSQREHREFTCNFLYLCTGYYDYEQGYTPEWPGVQQFHGEIVHPQKWPKDFDYANKRIVVIGSGATAITLVPALAEKASHVTMLQRSPSYVVNRPAEDIIANTLRRCLPDRAAYVLARWKNVLAGTFFYNLARNRPELFKWMLAKEVRRQLGKEYDSKHFTPHYNPWDQRLCVAPDADIFRAIRDGRVSVVTDNIKTFTEDGLLLESGQKLNADIIITATGLVFKLFSRMQLEVDGALVHLPDSLVYKGMMFSDVPNFAFAIGYTNASWTLKCDLTSEYVCRLLNHMDQHSYAVCTPRVNDPDLGEEPVVDFTSGYIVRALHTMPRQGTKTPWRLHQNYIKDLSMMRYGRVDDGAMEFKVRNRNQEQEQVLEGRDP
jgi:monooxygenase